ncbi:MAG: chloramphenicol acetyltransferase [Coxiellaceae bacterium]|nr:chloramphenicol acetyltransferase [Coxiellaceae bacterium]
MPDGEVWPHTLFLKNVIDHPHIHIGDFTYYNDFRKVIEDFRQLLFPYLHEFAPESVFVGKFVQIAQGVQIITSSANHQMDGFSTYPFCVFGEPWSSSYQPVWPNKGDTRIGNDVWLGHESVIMPAVSIGNGAIIAARSVVTRDVPAYSIVAGNPARVIRKRFSDAMIKDLEKIAWWDWPVDVITKHIPSIVAADIEALKNCSK